MTDYDLIIIGAGIHGAAVARAASYNGYKVCVLEQYPQPAMATSRSSSKLIHGGLRYLESFQFSLVRECLQERKILLKTAPHLVKLVPFYIPIYKHNTRPGWLIFFGLFIYRLLGGGKFRKLPTSEWDQLDGLNTKDLKSVYQYYDGQTNDQELTRAILDDAILQGTVFKADNKVRTIRVQKKSIIVQTENADDISSKLLINASGPWVNDVLKKVSPATSTLDIDLIQGTHIIIPRTIKQGIYYVEANDKRVVFFIPWQQHCLIGTTETPFTELPENCKPLKHEIDYLITTWNQHFNDKLSSNDILEAFSGLRVLPASGKNAFNRTRDTILHTKDNVISIYGGKLTAHRATADEVMNIIHKYLPKHSHIDTSTLSLNP